MTVRRLFPFLTTTLLLTALAGCAFDRQWQAASQFASPEYDLAGCWQGTWHNDQNGHQGTLRAIITRQGEHCFLGHFKARCAMAVPFEFEMPLFVTEDGAVYLFEGQEDLGLLAGGVVKYEGSASGNEFQTIFRTDNGRSGTITMTKVRSTDCGPVTRE